MVEVVFVCFFGEGVGFWSSFCSIVFVIRISDFCLGIIGWCVVMIMGGRVGNDVFVELDVVDFRGFLGGAVFV